MPRIRASFLLLVLVFTSPAHAQKVPPASAFFSVDGGVYVVPHDHFKEDYGSYYGSVVGASAGFPLSKRLYMQGMLSYFYKDQGKTIDMTIINVGLSYSFPVIDLMNVNLLGGYFRIDGDRTVPNPGLPASRIIGGFAAGGYLGLGLERELTFLPVAITMEAVRNINQKDFPDFRSPFDGIRIGAGVRYYLPQPGSR